MKKILIVHPYNDYTGSTIVLSTVIEKFLEQGKSLSIITNDTSGKLDNYSDLIKIHKIRQVKIFGKKVKFVTYVCSKFQGLILSLYYGFLHDCIYINTILPYYAAIAALFNRAKVIYHIHEKFVRYTPELKFAEFIFNHTKATRIYVSNYLMNQYPDRKGCRSIVKYNKLSKDFMGKLDPSDLNSRNLDTCLMVCSLNKSKGIFSYIELARYLPNIKFILVISSSQDKIDSYLNCSLPPNLQVFPLQTNLHPFYKQADLLLSLTIPSFDIETFGMTILEAMAYSVPAIVPNIGGPTELVQDGYNGYCVDVTNIETLEKIVLKALNEEVYVNLSRHASDRFKLLNV